MIRTGWQYLPALDPAPVTITRAMQRGAGPSVSGSALTNAYTEPSQAQVRSYKWHGTMVCELDTLTDAWNLAIEPSRRPRLPGPASRKPKFPPLGCGRAA